MMVTMKCYCRCGATLRGTMPAGLAKELAGIWAKEHSGAGHGAATPQEASRSRRRYDRPKSTNQRYP